MRGSATPKSIPLRSLQQLCARIRSSLFAAEQLYWEEKFALLHAPTLPLVHLLPYHGSCRTFSALLGFVGSCGWFWKFEVQGANFWLDYVFGDRFYLNRQICDSVLLLAVCALWHVHIVDSRWSHFVHRSRHFSVDSKYWCGGPDDLPRFQSDASSLPAHDQAFRLCFAPSDWERISCEAENDTEIARCRWKNYIGHLCNQSV